MSIYTRAEIVEMLELYKEAEKAALAGQSYTIKNRSLTRANLSEIRQARQEWEQRLVNFDVRARGGSSSYAASSFS